MPVKMDDVSPLRPGTIAVGLVAVLAFGALVVLGNTDVTRPASPPSETPEITYVGCLYDVPNGEVGRRLTEGEDPATLPGVTAVCTSPGPATPRR